MVRLCGDGMRQWFVEFEGGKHVSFCASEDKSRDEIYMMAREMLRESLDFETRRASMGRIIRAYSR